MIIVDLSQIMISSILSQIGNHTNIELGEDLIRHIVLNTIRATKNKFDKDHELIIACDDKHYWRREYFPHYKANRKKEREKSEIDWTALFNTLNKIKQELKEHFPYPVIQVQGAEADDVIATMVKWSTVNNVRQVGVVEEPVPIVIVSGDKDFIQLHSGPHIQQFDVVNKKQVKNDNPAQYLREHILKGDRGDGIPNVLSPASVIIDGGRQNKLTSKRMEQLLNTKPTEYPTDVYERYITNATLIDLNNVPTKIGEQIIEEYKYQQQKGRDKLFNYFVKHKLKHLMEHIGEY